MKLMAFAFWLIIARGVVFADDPGNPDSVYIGNLDGSPTVVGLGQEISIPVWIKTDDSVAFVHFPLASENSYVAERLGGEHVNAYCIPNMPPGFPSPFSCVFLNPDNMNQNWTNQSVVGFWDYNEGFHTQYEWCHKFNFWMQTTPEGGMLGDTVFCFAEGYNPINGSLLFGLSDGITEVIPQVVYGGLYFAETGFDDNNLYPGVFELYGAFPNPFNAATTVEFSLSGETEIKLAIYDILGRKTAVLFEGSKEAGSHSEVWDAAGAPSGIYFARLETEFESRSIKMVLLK